MLDPHRVDSAAGRFRAFFQELAGTFLERDDVLRQIALALLCKQHALLTGPPGTAKSALATAVFGRIVCEHTGEPSVYQRQITESTVQTDLIGPIDFKHLMETGRTAHFTDEGMLGAAHAFLDEVFDGRDMLLRSALNVLQERELKEGNRVTRGQIEVALMTTNRYIADVLDQARETLLAFVDRVAFVGFVPRGFADPQHLAEVLERHVSHASRGRLDALLTIQDVDVLQELVDAVVVSPPVCAALAELLAGLDAELNAAVRADPTFVPTRYLSTRTAVRSGEVLRAICVYERIFGDAAREMQVMPSDLKWLRLHVLLSGPQPEEVNALLEREVDPSERRQLEIVRTEREIFDRCLGRLPKFAVKKLTPPRAAATSETPPESAPKKKGAKAAAKAPEPTRVAALEAGTASADVKDIMLAVRELTKIAAGGDDDASEARAALDRGLQRLRDIVVRATLDATMADAPLLDTIEQLVALTATVDDDTISKQGLANWLRERCNQMIVDVARCATGARSTDLAPGGDRQLPVERVQRHLDVLERLSALRSRSSSANQPPEVSDPTWQQALANAEDDIAALWDAAFCSAAQVLLGQDPNAPLSVVLGAIEMELAWLDDIDERLGALRRGPSTIKAKAIGGRLTDLVESLMRRVQKVDRSSIHEEIEAVMVMLRSAKLEGTIAAHDWMRWATEALVRSTKSDERELPKKRNHDGYRAIRAREPRTPIAYTLAEVALRVTPIAEPSPKIDAAELLAKLPPELQTEAASIDLKRLERATRYLEAWWADLSSSDMPVAARLDAVVRSRFFDVVWDESALTRFALEAQLIGEIFPSHADRAQLLRTRLWALEATSRRGAQALLRGRTDEAWQRALGGNGKA